MADFNQAVKWMEEGKAVRRASTGNKFYKIWISQDAGSLGFLFYEHSDLVKPAPVQLTIESIRALDWELHEEEKSLSDKEWSNGCFAKYNDPGYAERDVKTAVQKILNYEWHSENGNISQNQVNRFYDLLKKTFGSKFL